MTASDDRLVAQVARAVLDGTPVNWGAVESAASGSNQGILRQLRLIASVASVRSDASADSPASWTASRLLHSLTAPQPETWGHLRVLECVGHGAFGAVYRAWDSRLDREVAVKIIAASRPIDSSSIIEEGRMLASVRHPNVVTIHGAERIGNEIGLWMEFVRGETLEALLQRGTPFAISEALSIVAEVCRAVAAVHAAGLVHRDIKAANVMRADDGRVILMDFGTGRRIGEEAQGWTGTPMYLAPEVLSGAPATVESDVFSLGVLLNRLLTGRYPVEASTLADLQQAHALGRRQALAGLRPDLPTAVVRLVDRALDADPSHRYVSAAAMGNELARAATPRSRRHLARGLALGLIGALGAAIAWSAAVGREPSLLNGLPTPPRIAILPFENLGSSPSSDEVTQGLTLEVQRGLTGLEGLTLRSFISSAEFPPGRRDLREVGSQLDVDLVLDGTVLRSANRVRVIPRLVRVRDEATLWTEVFDRPEADLVSVLEDIPQAIVNRLRLTLGPGRRRYEIDPGLVPIYLQARGFQARRYVEDARKAVQLFEQIVVRDPSHVPSWAGLVSAAASVSRLGQGPERQMLAHGLAAAALKAIQLDPFLADAQAAMANLFANDRKWSQAEAGFRRAIELDPSLTTTHTDFVLSTLLPQGRLDDAREVLEAARIADPLSLDVRRVMALIQVESGSYEQAIESSRWVLDRDPSFPFARSWLGRALALSGRKTEAIDVFGEEPVQWGYYGYALAVTGRRVEAEAIAAARRSDPRVLLMVYGGLGDEERTFAALEQMAASDWWRALTWMTRPEVQFLRDDVRFEQIRRRLLQGP